MLLMLALIYLSQAPVSPPLQQSTASAQPVPAMLAESSAEAATVPAAQPVRPVLTAAAAAPEPDTAAVAPPASGLIDRPPALQSPLRSLRQEDQRAPASATPRPAVAATNAASGNVSTAPASRALAPVRAATPPAEAAQKTGAMPDLPVAADSATSPTAIPVPAVTAPIAAPTPGPVAVPLSALKFSRYVEPSDRAWRRRSQPAGWVEIAFRVETDGETADVAVTASSPAGLYEDAAIAAVKRWRFRPVVQNGQ
jgi:protein TonB